LEAWQKDGFDAILMDVQMPEMNGWEATQAIREKERTTGDRIPIIAMTAHAMKGDDERCFAAGMDDYLTKPIRSEELIAALDKAANRKAARQVKLQPTTSQQLSGVIELDAALERLGGDRELYGELVDVFRKECPAVIEEMRRAIASGDAKTLGRGAHTLRGAASNLGAACVSEAAAETERRANSEGIGSATEEFKVLEEEMKRLFSELEVVCGK